MQNRSEYYKLKKAAESVRETAAVGFLRRC